MGAPKGKKNVSKTIRKTLKKEPSPAPDLVIPRTKVRFPPRFSWILLNNAMHGPQSHIQPQAARVEKDAALLPPMERVEAVRSHWATLLEEERSDMLSVSLQDLRRVAADVAQSARTTASE